ncbi:MAG: monovalent cation:proton antiporter-2 (CPA2) family protein [Acidiferrobacterales bacterium]
MNLLYETVIFLGAAMLAVPLFRQFGFGSVLGYLAAGVLIGPWCFGLIGDVESILNFAELGVVLLLFIIGLELQPSRLWVLRKSIFGLGATQVVVTASALALCAYGLGLSPATSVIVGLGLALSSTAFVLQMLAEKKQLTTAHGRSAFAILLFQDVAFIPILALIPLLGVSELALSGTDGFVQAVKVALVLIAICLGGHFVLRHVFRFVARWGGQEIFTATALLVVIGAALLMDLVGLSMALGSFLAGVLLADSEYRHELEANIEPFKGLLLGLFFIAVGMSANISLIGDDPLQVLGLMAGLLLVKFVVLFAVGKLFGYENASARNLAFVLPQGGEFAFVLFSAAVIHQVLARDLAELLILVVTLTMVATPLLFLFNEFVLRRSRQLAEEFDTMEDTDHEVIIAGFGRMGQIIGRILRVKKIPFTALDASSSRVDFVRRFGNKIYYGDPSRLDLLRAAHAHKAKIFVLVTEDMISSVRTVETVKKHFPNLDIYARAHNRRHAHLLMDIGVKYLIRETYLSSLEMAEHVLRGLGKSEDEAQKTVQIFKCHDEATLVQQHAIHHDESKFIQSVKEAASELEELFESDVEPSDIHSTGA